MHARFPDEARKCSEWLRHKNHMVSASVMEKAGIKVVRVRQVRCWYEYLLPFHASPSHNLTRPPSYILFTSPIAARATALYSTLASS